MDSGKVEKIEIEEVRLEIAGGDARAVDVRDEDGWKDGHVVNAIHMPGGEPSPELEGLEENCRLIVFAKNDRAAGKSAKRLCEQGFDAAIAKGGMKAWNKKGFNIQPTADPSEETELGRA